VNLQELRDAVRNQLDTDETEVPNTLVDLFLRDAYNRTMQLEERWPFFQSSWSLASSPLNNEYARDSTISNLVQVFDATGDFVLAQLDHVLAAQAYGDGTTMSGTPHYWSEWGGNIYLWPTPSEARSYSMIGYRRPQDWIASGASAEVDADERLHLPLFYYATSLVYAQQEDELLEAMYMTRYQQSVNQARNDIMRVPQHRPLVMSRGRPYVSQTVTLDAP